MKIYHLLFVLFLTFICANCSNQISADPGFIPKPFASPRVIESKAKISLEQVRGVKTTETFFNLKESNSKIYFVDENNGWLIGNKNLYRTENGGESWGNVPIKVEEEAGLGNIFFVNQSVGWINIQKYGDVTGKSSKSWLIKTIDGGETWQNLAVQNFTRIDEVKFIDEKNGWIIGSTHNPENVYDSKQFFKKTSDGGNSWTEIGKELFEKNGKSQQMITGLIAETPENLKVVMWSGLLFKTEDAGKSWERFGPQFEFPAQTIPDNFGKLGNSNRLRMARGTWSIEGIYSYIATEKNGDWTIRWTDEPFCIYDIVFLSENEMIAIGRLGINLYEENNREEGVIVYSSDAGENWKTVYRNESISNINSIAKISENQFMAVGDRGLIINIEFGK